MQHFVLAFIFTSDLQKVLLILKNRPTWQAGNFNGIGGKIEPGETAAKAICREVEEETGIRTKPAYWQYMGKMVASNWDNEIFTMALSPKISPQSITDEEVSWHSVVNVPTNSHSNLPWLIPLAKNMLTTPQLNKVEIFYT